ncbi:hypothetical protein [Piscinibacter sp.]|uniref:hypothetical protein n=1 Tax=Piscinibacter sp. TaxID=1903157 RepID=UPI002B664634|nr:hypothetical protein [Albitalea sp.]HUG25220.1 hypothetical protein [Albitalea sp.]
MQFNEHDEGDYRIYAGALESSHGDGYIAAVVVSRVRGADRAPREAYRDESLACGHRWERSDQALSYAIGRGREVVRTERQRLAC